MKDIEISYVRERITRLSKKDWINTGQFCIDSEIQYDEEAVCDLKFINCKKMIVGLLPIMNDSGSDVKMNVENVNT